MFSINVYHVLQSLALFLYMQKVITSIAGSITVKGWGFQEAHEGKAYDVVRSRFFPPTINPACPCKALSGCIRCTIYF